MIVSAKRHSPGLINVTLSDGGVQTVREDSDNPYYKGLLEWVAQGNTIAPEDPPGPPPTLEDEINSLPPLWKATFEAYVEQQPRNKNAIINNIKRHLK
jgi:hypothetical protein